ncbi:Chain length determinant protein [Chitinophaga sp. YR627]|uniref:hypothetical protein n=1 Tax=Chitinophaga sp. YR627 TaxID=1881041 RepID=UPI0008E99B65|nr:hypothetical protein [Chitinophaga sp. YR627]SFN91840.1 Chain length determinant protein [Chitinophaga sp. YR627]
MEQDRKEPTGPKDEITLRDAVLLIRGWCRYLLSKWIIIGLFVIVGAVLGALVSFMSKPAYDGALTFVLEDAGGGGTLNAYAGIASQFGVDLGGGGSVGVLSGENIMEFLESRLIVEKALLSTAVLDGKKMTLAEMYIDMYNLREKWKKSPVLASIHFPVEQKRASFSLKQDSILYELCLRVVNKNLEVAKSEKKSAFITVTTTSGQPVFSKSFTEALVQEATTFYVDTKTKRSKVNVDKLQLTADSIELLLNRKTYALAATQDANMNPLRQTANVNTELQTRDKLVLQTMYTEVIKNLELSKMSMAQETPIVQVIDTPIMPLKMKKLGLIIGVIAGMFAGGVLIVGVLIIRKIYQNLAA